MGKTLRNTFQHEIWMASNPLEKLTDLPPRSWNLCAKEERCAEGPTASGSGSEPFPNVLSVSSAVKSDQC